MYVFIFFGQKLSCNMQPLRLLKMFNFTSEAYPVSKRWSAYHNKMCHWFFVSASLLHKNREESRYGSESSEFIAITF